MVSTPSRSKAATRMSAPSIFAPRSPCGGALVVVGVVAVLVLMTGKSGRDFTGEPFWRQGKFPAKPAIPTLKSGEHAAQNHHGFVDLSAGDIQGRKPADRMGAGGNGEEAGGVEMLDHEKAGGLGRREFGAFGEGGDKF